MINRRSFLKRCSLLPFVGSLAVTSKAGASEDKPVSLFGESDKDVPFSAHISSDGETVLTREMYANAINDMESDEKRRSGTRLVTEKEYQDALTEGVQDALTEVVKEKLVAQDIYVYYNFAEKVKITYKIDGDVHTIINYEKFTEHPFCSFGKTQEKIDSGEITYLIQNEIV